MNGVNGRKLSNNTRDNNPGFTKINITSVEPFCYYSSGSHCETFNNEQFVGDGI